MIEHSIQNGIHFVAFEPKEPKTWNSVKSTCSNSLNGLWLQGGLAGAKAQESFFVKVGLGETMTSQDILDNNLIVEIGMALVRPAEFIIIRIKLKTSSS